MKHRSSPPPTTLAQKCGGPESHRCAAHLHGPNSPLPGTISSCAKIRRRASSRFSTDRIARVGSGKKGDPYRYKLSCSLVPDYGWEQENENPKIAENSDAISADSCSHDSGEVTSSGTRVAAEQNHNPSTDLVDDLFSYATERIPPLPPPPTQPQLEL